MAAPSSIQEAEPLSVAMGMVRVPELVWMVCARVRKMLFSSSPWISWRSN